MTQTANDRPASPPTWLAAPSKPKQQPPPGSCDACVHIFGPRSRFPFTEGFPFADGHYYTPSDAPKETLFAIHEFLGINHGVIVQPNCHGYDNSAIAEAASASRGTYCAIALVPVTVGDDDLKRLDAAGVRGARFHYMRHLAKGASIDEVLAFGRRLADLGWHLQLQMQADMIHDMTPALQRSPVTVMIDHMGRLDASMGLNHPYLRDLLTLMQDRNLWLKVSGIDRATRQGPPYADAIPLARKLVDEIGDRVVWGSDWPHPNPPGAIPDDGALIDVIAEIAPKPAQIQALMVDNPQRFYHFASSKRQTAAKTAS
jgi:2-pyrone-4,6-dicarboxylate lactonase